MLVLKENMNKCLSCQSANPTLCTNQVWNHGARKIFPWISLNFNALMLVHIYRSQSPKEAWDKLPCLYVVNTKARKTQSKGLIILKKQIIVF